MKLLKDVLIVAGEASVAGVVAYLLTGDLLKGLFWFGVAFFGLGWQRGMKDANRRTLEKAEDEVFKATLREVGDEIKEGSELAHKKYPHGWGEEELDKCIDEIRKEREKVIRR